MLPTSRSSIAQDVTDVLEVDASIRDVFSGRDTSRYHATAESYLLLLETNPERLSGAAAAAHRRHVLAFLSILPDGTDFGPSMDGAAEWWRRQDPFPATRENERLEEHLARFAFALNKYPLEEDERGYDDRGEIFIRYGPPSRQISVELSEIIQVFDLSRGIPVPDLPENELWLYRNLGDEAHYFFLRTSSRDGFNLDIASDLLPLRLLSGLDSRTERGRDKTDILLIILEEVYAQLALAHPFYGPTFDRIAHYRAQPPERADRPILFARSTLAYASGQEIKAAGRREEVLPASASNTHDHAEELPVEMRWARFLDEDGTTRTEIYWTVEAEDLEPSKRLVRELTEEGQDASDEYLLSMTVARMGPDFLTRDRETKHYHVRPSMRKALTAQSFVIQGDTARYNLGLQWNQYWASQARDSSFKAGALLKVGTGRINELHALHGRGEHLESSDLMPVEHDHPDTSPFPFKKIDGNAPPDLYFELYNLHFGADDLTHYTIEYNVAREGRQARSTSVRANYSGTERHTRERIDLDLGRWSAGEQLLITVIVTDEVTRERVERAISFEL